MAINNNTKLFYNTTIPSDWEEVQLINIALINMGQSPDSISYNTTEEGLPLIQGNADMFERQSIQRIYTTQITKVCDKGDFILSVRAPVGSIGIASTKSCIGRGVCSIKPKNIERDYLLQLLLNSETKWSRVAQGSTFSAVSSTDVKTLKLLISKNPKEQRAIAKALSLVDTAINLNMQLIAQKELRKRWLMQNLLTGKKKLKGFSGEWIKYKLKNILTLAGKPLSPVKDELYQQIGIRSHTKGIFHKEKVTGATLGNKRVFWIEPDCFVVNIVFAWEHAIAKTTEKEVGMIASHRFPMYKPKNEILDLNYLLYYFKSPRGKYLLGLASPGGAGRNKTLGKSEFLKLKIPVPSLKEQKAIAQILTTADKEIQLLKTKTEKLREQKKGMMQVLLTGKKRLKVN